MVVSMFPLLMNISECFNTSKILMCQPQMNAFPTHTGSMLRATQKEAFKDVIEKLASQLTSLHNDVLDPVTWMDTMTSYIKQPTRMTFTIMEWKQPDDGIRRNNTWCSYASTKVGYATCTCRNKEEVLVTWKDRKAGSNKGTDIKENRKEERCGGSHGDHKKGGYRGRAEQNQPSLHWPLTFWNEIDHSKVQEFSNSASDNDGDLDDLGSGNGDMRD